MELIVLNVYNALKILYYVHNTKGVVLNAILDKD